MKQVAVLVNPTAGRGRGGAIGDAAASRLRELGADVRVLVGDSPEDTKRLAAAALRESSREDPLDALVMVGGDGTLSLILDEVLGSSTPVAIVPAGTGNDLARSLDLPLGSVEQCVEAAELALQGEVRRVDVGEAECAGRRRRFFTIAALGFDAHVAERTNRLHRPRGRLRYYLALVIELVRLRPMRFSMSVDDGPLEERPGILVAIGNTRSYGGGMPMCPDADAEDGLLDVTHVGPIGRARLVRLFPLLLRARHAERPEVTQLRGRAVEVSAPGLVVYADGERVGEESVRFRVLPGALAVLAPVRR